MATFRCNLLRLGIAILAVSSASAQPTWSREVSRIAQAKCQLCHRPNDIAPFALMTYDDARDHAMVIKAMVGSGVMPPWKPVAGHGSFKDSYALTAEERQTILDWVDAGAPEGDPADLPEMQPQTGEWVLGEPDRVIQMAEPYQPPANQPDTYRCFVLNPALDQDINVRAVQVIPGNREMVHHVILFIDTTGQADKLDAGEEGPGYTCWGGPGLDISANNIFDLLSDRIGGLGGWVPGTRPQELPDGVGIFVPKDARIIMQVHYHPHGDDLSPDQTKFGLYYTKTEVEKRLRYIPIANTSFKLEPGKPGQEVTAQLHVLPFLDAKALQIAPHMHLLGRQIKVERIRARDSEDLVYIDNWDFHWQGFYTFEDPVRLRAGDAVKLTCTFDGHPDKVVGWGEGTEDEMCLAFLGVTFDWFK